MLFANVSSLAALSGFVWQTGNWMVNSAQNRLESIQQSFGGENRTFPNDASSSTAAMASYSLPPLGYSYDALEPYFDKETMEIHHSKHHQTYVNNLNNLLKEHGELSSLAVDQLVTRIAHVPADKATGVRNNAGGHSNHSFFWRNLKTGTELQKGSPLEQAIARDFGSVDEFRAQFEKAATTVFGSGWAWLVERDGALRIVTTPNQDSPLMGAEASKGFPIIGLDVWEHAYYLKFQNRRPDYIKAFWSVVNWDFAQQRFEESK